MDFEAEGMLDGLSGDQRAARLALLERLAADGFGLEELRNAVAEDRLALLPRRPGPGRPLHGRRGPRADGATGGARASDPAATRAARASAPRTRVFVDEDIEAARSTKLFLDAGFDEERDRRDLPRAGRGHGAAVRDRDGGVRRHVPGGGRQRGGRRRALRRAGRAAHAGADPGRWCAAFRGHLRDSVRRGMLGREELESGDVPAARSSRCASPTWSASRGSAARSSCASSAAWPGGWRSWPPTSREPPVRLIKTIGDAAMFVSPEPGAARRGRAEAASRRPRRPSSRASAPGSRSGRRCCAPATTTATRSTSPAA